MYVAVSLLWWHEEAIAVIVTHWTPLVQLGVLEHLTHHVEPALRHGFHLGALQLVVCVHVLGHMAVTFLLFLHLDYFLNDLGRRWLGDHRCRLLHYDLRGWLHGLGDLPDDFDLLFLLGLLVTHVDRVACEKAIPVMMSTILIA